MRTTVGVTWLGEECTELEVISNDLHMHRGSIRLVLVSASVMQRHHPGRN